MDSSERLQILHMLQQGDISVEDALGQISPPATPPAVADSPGEPRWLHVRVSNLETGKRKVSVNVPLKVMKWGLALGARFSPELTDLNLDQMLTDLQAYGTAHLVDVQDADGNERVEVFVD